MTWRIEISTAAARQLDRISARDRERILRFLYDRVAAHSNPMALAKRLSGSAENLSRFRVGDYRIIAQFINNRMVVLVVEIGNRREVYR
jgi:mRNA interferase RelE/StbE